MEKTDNKQNINLLKTHIGRDVQLIKYEIFKNGDWQDYSITNNSINKTKKIKIVYNDKLLFDNNIELRFGNDKRDKVKIINDGFQVLFDDSQRTRWYRGFGMRLTYKFVDKE